VRVREAAFDHDLVRRVDEHLARDDALHVQRRLLRRHKVDRQLQRIVEILRLGRAVGLPAVTAVAEEADVRVARELVHARALCARRPFERLQRFRQVDAARARLDAAAEDVGIAPPAARLGVEAACRRRHLAEKFRRGARVVQQVEARVRVKAADDLVVVQLHHRIPAIHHLRELRERQAVEVDQRRQQLSMIGGAHLRSHSLQRRALVRTFAHQQRAVLLAVLLPGDFGARRLQRFRRQTLEPLRDRRSLRRRHGQCGGNLVHCDRDRAGRLGVQLFLRRGLRRFIDQQCFAGRRRELCERLVDALLGHLGRCGRVHGWQLGAVPFIRLRSFDEHELRGRFVAGVDAVVTAADHDCGQ
jgi:hypothetical protein